MKLIEKRSAIRDLRNNGKLLPLYANLTGEDVVKLDNDMADEILVKHGISVVGDFDEIAKETPPPAPPSTPSAPPAPVAVASNAQADALSALIATLTPKSDNEELNALTKRVETIEQTKPRELVVTTPKQEKKNIGLVHKEFDTLLTSVSCGLHAYLVGPAGSFKTSAGKKVAEALSLKCSALSVCQQTTAVALLGYMNATGEYVSTEFRKRYQFGGVFILDEIDNGNSNVISVLNSALSNDACAFPDGMVEMHEDFRLVATANTFGQGANAQYVGRCQLDAATLDRFVFIQWDYDSKMEMAIAGNDSWCKRVQSLRASAARLKSRIVISPRATFKGAKLLAAGMGQSKVEDIALWGGTSKEEREKIIAGAR